MISGIVEHISNTKIFTGIVYPAKIISKNNKIYKIPEGKPLQLTIYSSQILFREIEKYSDLDIPGIRIFPNLLILPFPLISGENRIKILNFKQYSNFFEDLDLIFPTKNREGLINTFYQEIDPELNKFVENYTTSIVPNFNLIYKNPNIRNDIKEYLKTYYGEKYGFILVNIFESGTLFPICYVSEIKDERLFVPIKSFLINKPMINKPALNLTEVNDFIYGTLTIEDEWLLLNEKKEKNKSIPEPKLFRDHEIYIVNFSRILKNPVLQKPGLKIINGDLNRTLNFYTYIENKKLPKEIALIKPKMIFKILIDQNWKYNYDFFL